MKQELAPVSVELTSIYTYPIAVAPLESDTVVAKVCELPLPDAGSTETTEGGPEPGTVQTPGVLQPLPTAVVSYAATYTFLAPAYDAFGPGA